MRMELAGEAPKAQEDEVRELNLLLACYQRADSRDRRIVWAVLNRYAPFVDLP